MTKKDPAESDKPDYLTGYMMCKDILPELSKRINLGAHKYEPDDWKKRDPKYFWQKLHRHMKDAATDWNSVDEDGLPHLTAMWFHITALVWKRQDEQTVSQAEWYKPHPGFHGENDETDTPSKPAETDEVLCLSDWAIQEGYVFGKGERYEGMRVPKYSHLDLQKLYQEYLAERKNAKDGAEADK